MKKVLFILFTLSHSLCLIGQGLEISWGEIKENTRLSKREIKGSVNDNYYVLEKEKGFHGIRQYNFNHKLVSSAELPEKQGVKSVRYFPILSTRSKSYLLSSCQDPKLNKIHFYKNNISSEGKISFERLKICSIDFANNIIGGAGIHTNKDTMGFVISPDSSMVVISVAPKLRDRGKEKYNIYVFDENLNDVWHHKVELPIKDKEFKTLDISIFNNGTVLISGKHQMSINESEIKFFKVNRAGDVQQIKVVQDNVKLRSVSVLGDFEKGINITGLYFKEKGRKKLEFGVYFYRFSATGKIMQEVYCPMQEKYRFQKNYGKIFTYDDHLTYKNNGLAIRNVLTDYENRNLVITSEIEFYEEKMGIHTNEIFVHSISFDGKINWIKEIKKDHLTKNLGIKTTGSYLFTYSNGNFYFIFNDEKTLGERRQFDFKGKLFATFTHFVELNNVGEIERDEILYHTSASNKLLFRKGNSMRTKDGVMLLYFENMMKNRIGILKIR